MGAGAARRGRGQGTADRRRVGLRQSSRSGDRAEVEGRYGTGRGEVEPEQGGKTQRERVGQR